MKSTLGRRASICKEMGFTLGFVEHGISYVKLQMMMLDMPRVDYGEKGEESCELTDDNAEDFFNMLVESGRATRKNN
jgi:hypothetical protein